MRDSRGAAPKRDAAAAVVRAMIADGTLKPGAPVPSGAALAKETGYAHVTCRRALRALLADGTLTTGVSRNARLRVAAQPGAAGDVPAARAALSAALGARRRAAGMTQPELAAALGVSVTTVGHAETGRLWQSREFWQRADGLLGDVGDLLRMHDGYVAASAGEQAERGPAGDPTAAHASRPAGHAVPCGAACAGVTITWCDGSQTTVYPPAGPDPTALSRAATGRRAPRADPRRSPPRPRAVLRGRHRSPPRPGRPP